MMKRTNFKFWFLIAFIYGVFIFVYGLIAAMNSSDYYVKRKDMSDLPGCEHHNCRYLVIDLNHDPLAEEMLKFYAERTQEEKIKNNINAYFLENLKVKDNGK